MRDKNRISKVLNQLEQIWEAYPDLRLGQLLLNVVRDPALYYIEDDELVTRAETFYGIKADNASPAEDVWVVRDAANDIFGYFRIKENARKYALKYYEENFGEADREEGTYENYLCWFEKNDYIPETVSVEPFEFEFMD